MSYYQALILMCVFENLVLKETTFALFLDGNNFALCEESSTLPGYGVVVTHGQPSHVSGTVVIESSLNESLGLANPMCTWTYRIHGVTVTKQELLAYGSNLFWIFSKAGLQKVLVTAEFPYRGKQQTMKNCTFVNVTDCNLKPKVKVSTSTGSYNISQNHTDVNMNFPGLVNFTLSIFTIDPYYICKHLYFFWDLGDGRNASGKHVQHYYNKTGVYSVVLKIFKVFEDDGRRKFVRNITMKIFVEDCYLKPKVKVSTSTGSYNISRNHNDVNMDSPGLVNFTLSIFRNDPYHICKQLYFFWDLGDGRNASGKNVQHYYNKTGVYSVVLKIYKVFEDDSPRKFVRNITMKIFVEDCYLKAKVKVSTSSGSYNISQNHTDVNMDSPGLVNFTLSIFRIDPHHICKHLYFFWDLGDGRNASGKHVEHYYNKTGVYSVVLKIYKVFEDDGPRKFVRNITMKIFVEDCYLKAKVEVSTSSGSYNISRNHNDVNMDSPGLVNFTLSIFRNDPHHICKQLYFFWDLGDGRNASGKNVQHYYNKTGVYSVVLKIYKVFKHDGQRKFVRNITMKIFVEDCYLKAKVKVSTSSGSYNISQNHTDVNMDSPGLVNFTLSIFRIDPHHICKHLYFFWDLGDGRNTSGKHVQHYYNKTGVYSVVLKIYKVFERDGERKFVRDITMKIHIKEKHAPTKSMNTVIDVSLVLAIFFVCFVFVLCIAAYWFRRRLHRHTEVARFDFRESELQSDFDEHEHCSRISSNGKGCMNAMTCRKGSNEHLLNFAQNEHYSSCKNFGGTNLNEDL